MKMKKMFAVLMMAVIACGLLVGCGGGQKPADNRLSVSTSISQQRLQSV